MTYISQLYVAVYLQKSILQQEHDNSSIFSHFWPIYFTYTYKLLPPPKKNKQTQILSFLTMQVMHSECNLFHCPILVFKGCISLVCLFALERSMASEAREWETGAMVEGLKL